MQLSSRQLPLFPPEVERSFDRMDAVGAQGDIRYFGTRASTALNPPGATGMSFWSVNPYVGCAFGCTYCYARYAHAYAIRRGRDARRFEDGAATTESAIPPWLAFERQILVKRNLPDVLARALRHGSARHAGLVQGEMLLIGSATDPYQPAERRFRLTRQILEVLAGHPGLRVVIITKSPLVTRDVDVLARIARHSTLQVQVSLITTDRELARRIEPRAPTPASRLRAIERLARAGVAVGVNCMPVLPGITDDPAALDDLVRRVAAAGATRVGACALRLDRSARERYLPFINSAFPELAARYRATYAHSRHAGERYRAGLAAYVAALCERHGVENQARHGDD